MFIYMKDKEIHTTRHVFSLGRYFVQAESVAVEGNIGQIVLTWTDLCHPPWFSRIFKPWLGGVRASILAVGEDLARVRGKVAGIVRKHASWQRLQAISDVGRVLRSLYPSLVANRAVRRQRIAGLRL